MMTSTDGDKQWYCSCCVVNYKLRVVNGKIELEEV